MKLRWFAVAALLALAVPISRRVALEVTGEHTTARVTALEEVENDEDGHVDRPVFEFTDTRGASHTIRGAAMSPTLYSAGETVPVVYAQSAPEDTAMVGPAIMRWWWYALAVAICAAIAMPWPLATGSLTWRRSFQKKLIAPGLVAMFSLGLCTEISTAATRVWIGSGSLLFAALLVLELRAAICPRCTRLGPTCCKDAPRIPRARAMWPTSVRPGSAAR